MAAPATDPKVQDPGSPTSVMNADHRITPIDSSVEWRVPTVQPLRANGEDTGVGDKQTSIARAAHRRGARFHEEAHVLITPGSELAGMTAEKALPI
jgi:hypothetical protein